MAQSLSGAIALIQLRVWPEDGPRMAGAARVAGGGPVPFGLKMALVWRVAGPGAAFGLKMARYGGWLGRVPRLA